jgi:hypothetical protein
MKSFLKNQFIVNWKNIKKETLDQSKRVYSMYDYDEDSILFI